jgi:Zn-dependent M16 (insulinase) family peptidase
MDYIINKNYHGFTLQDKKNIAEINSLALLFLHDKSGARLLKLQTNDDNKVFSIGFKTPPPDDTGLPHILEHSVLCGSAHFNTKEPFVELAKSSLETFLNAMTFADKTVYVIASRNRKDYFNLMHVYLDAVFYPNIHRDPLILMQEGWHFEIDDAKKPLSYNGVVYNEMKGVYSSPFSLIFQAAQKTLFPDSCYGKESGGDPEEIPNLTYERFVEYHSRYYHPSNSYIYLYGDGALDEELEFIDLNYLKDFSKIDVHSEISIPAPLSRPAVETVDYAVGDNESPDDKSYHSITFACGDALDAELSLALEILEYVLLETPASPLKKALLKEQIGKDVSGHFEDDILKPVFMLLVKNSSENKRKLFEDCVYSTLNRLAAEGIDPELIQSSCNRVEFMLREADSHGPKGIQYGFLSLIPWIHGGSPFLYLGFEHWIKTIRGKCESGKYFEGLIREYLLSNKNRTQVSLRPVKGLIAEKEKQTVLKLEAYKRGLSQTELASLIALNSRLREKQATPDSEAALASIPRLALSDINKKATIYPLDIREESNIKVLYSDLPTNGIAYVNMLFNSMVVPEEDIRYIQLLVTLLGKINTRQYDYSKLSKTIDMHTGGISFSTETAVNKEDDSSYTAYLKVRSKALVSNIPRLFDLLAEMTLHTLFNDADRVLEVIRESISGYENSIMWSGSSFGLIRLLSYYSQSGCYREMTEGFEYYFFLKKLEKKFEADKEAILGKLSYLAGIIFSRANLSMSLTVDNPDYAEFGKALPAFLGEYPETKQKVCSYLFPLSEKNEGMLIPSQVQYVIQGYNFRRSGFGYSGQLQVIRSLIELDYLWNHIRVKGGAYGSGMVLTRSGHLAFTTYRDPNLGRSLSAFRDIPAYLKSASLSEKELEKYIIGTIGNLEPYMSSDRKAERAVRHYLSGVTQEDEQKERDEILSMNLSKIKGIVPWFEKVLEPNIICVVGNENKINEEKYLFKNIVSVFD